MDQQIDPLDVPTHLLRAAYLLGKTPFRATRADPRISYSLYIPDQYKIIHSSLQQQRRNQQTSTASLSTPLHSPSTSPNQPQRLRLLLNIHSTRRDATTCRDSLIPLADSLGIAVLAPLFPAGLDGPLDLDSYKHVRSKTLKADAVLLAILDEVARMWPGIATEKVVLMGFSGGAQFVQRMVYVIPERITGVVIAAPGRTTMLGSQERWPKGVGNFGEVFGKEVDVEAIRVIGRDGGIGFVVGHSDDERAQEENLELVRWLVKKRAGATDASGEDVEMLAPSKGRLLGLKELREDWRQHGIESTIQIVPGVGHDYHGLLPAMADWLKEYPALLLRGL